MNFNGPPLLGSFLQEYSENVQRIWISLALGVRMPCQVPAVRPPWGHADPTASEASEASPSQYCPERPSTNPQEQGTKKGSCFSPLLYFVIFLLPPGGSR